MSELKPCRHCGGEVAIALHGNEFDEYWWTVQRGYDDETACGCRLFMDSEKFSLEDGEKPEDSPFAMEQKKKLIEKWNRSSPAPYEYRIAGYGRDWAEIMCDAFGDLVSCAGETCTTSQLSDLERHIEEWMGGMR